MAMEVHDSPGLQVHVAWSRPERIPRPPGQNDGRTSRMTSMTSRRYCLITPCRNEARFPRRTLNSTVGQSELPAPWVIVDDGSQDEPARLLAEYAARFPRLHVARPPDRAHRKLGGGVL